jgi:hypothetical protein|tara:strand:+ start:14118 stop:14693 length:576 start_codon:yes stop_codon:yes gene_type:complete
MKKIFTLIFLINISMSQSQENLPYYEIPDYPDSYTSGNIMSRMIDGLGFRFYWATEGLRNEDLSYRINSESRSSHETIDHIHNLSIVILNSLEGLPNNDDKNEKLDFKETRKQILLNLKHSSKILSKSDDLSKFKIIFQRSNNKIEYPFWNQINGPIEDAVWHSGQLAILRRASGNPINPKASVFSGKIKK